MKNNFKDQCPACGEKISLWILITNNNLIGFNCSNCNASLNHEKIALWISIISTCASILAIVQISSDPISINGLFWLVVLLTVILTGTYLVLVTKLVEQKGKK